MKHAIVTGAANGIGKAIALACANENIHVHACDVNNDALQLLNHENITTHQLDIGDSNAIADFYTGLTSPVHYLINNAGIYPAKNILDYTAEEIQRVLNINVTGTTLMTQHFAKQLLPLQQSGAIVNLGSVSQHGSSDAIYGASKGAISALTKSCAQNFAPFIRVNTIAPGLVQTAMLSDVPTDIQEKYKQGELISTPITPQAIADTALFLISNKAAHYTGATFDLNNGIHRH